MELLKITKVASIVLVILFLFVTSFMQIRSWIPDPKSSTTDQLQERIAARDSLVMMELKTVQIKMDSIDARSQRIESLQQRIPEIEAAIHLNLRSKDQLTTAEKSALRAEIIEYLNKQP